MIVALDVSHIDKLFKAPPKEQGRILGLWRERNCSLALTSTALRELVQHRNTELVESRMNFLDHFGTIRGIPNANFINRFECGFQATQLVTVGMLPEDTDVFLPRGREVLIPEWQSPKLKTYALTQLRNSAPQARDIDNTFAELENKLPSFRKREGRWSPPKGTIEDARRRIDDIVERDFKDPNTRAFMKQQLYRRAECEAKSHSYRQVVLCMHDLDGMDVARTAPFEDLVELAETRLTWTRSGLGRRLLELRTLRDKEHEQQVFRRLNPYLMPGTSLRIAMHRQRRRDKSRKVVGNDYPDAIALMLAPYVDLALVDKRVKDWVMRAARGDEASLIAPGALRTIAEARNNDALYNLLQNCQEVSIQT